MFSILLIVNKYHFYYDYLHMCTNEADLTKSVEFLIKCLPNKNNFHHHLIHTRTCNSNENYVC